MRERYVVTNRVRLFCVEAGRGPLVLLLHGFPEFWWSWRHQLPALADAGYRAVAVDLPGYGRSDKPAATYDEHWVNQCLAGLIQALGAERAVVVGHDWGGLLAWPFARRYPELTAGVVGVNTPDLPRLPMPPVQFFRQLSPRPNYIVQFQERGPAEWFLSGDVPGWMNAMYLGPATHRKEAFPPDVVARYAEQFQAVGSVTPVLEYYRNMDRNWELAADLPEQVQAPALMVMAADDPVLSPALAEGMEARVPNLRKVLIEDCGHWTQQEQPEQFNAALVGWLSETAPRTGG
ncbi:MAG TPA: alpha/beta hydrolase [Acidimicrobiales bacterium]|jgi:pimeloyl-ACP methyl ester carboxylesterase|nr:alpha/beta hydrolase [Acidimicrobiales bacterium]